MKLRDVLDGVELTELNADAETEIRGITCDSRRVEAGFLFIAIEGYSSDGHDYIPMALEKGAAAVLCRRAQAEGIPTALADDTRRAMALAAANFYRHPADEMKIIGVTGTNGKTTTTTLIKHLLESCGERVGLIGTNRNMIGGEEIPTERTTPESTELQALFRRMADAGCGWCVMEVSSHALALRRVDGFEFEMGIFTNLTQDHLDFHGTMENYLEAKARLFTLCRRGIINLDDASFEMLRRAAACPLYSYAIDNAEAELRAEDIALRADGIEFDAVCGDSRTHIKLGIPGQFSVYNALCVIAFGINEGMSMTDIAAALGSAEGVKGRVEVAYSGGDYTVLIDYAHTPDALKNVLNTVRGFAEGRTVVLFGCGGDRDNTKRPKMGRIAGEMADFAIVTSDNPRTEEPGEIIRQIVAGMENARAPYVVIEDRCEAIFWAMEHAQQGDVIILAGKGHETYQDVGGRKLHLDEREIIAEYLKKQSVL